MGPTNTSAPSSTILPRGMMAAVVVIAVVIATIVVAIPFTMLVGFRTRNRAILRAIRRLNRRVLNPMQLKSAGTPGAYAAVLYHRGRCSGQEYRTPLGATLTAPHEITIALPYGPDTDWMKNLRAAGSATMLLDGVEYHVDEPTVVPIASTEIADAEPMTVRVFKIDSALRPRAVVAHPASGDAPPVR